MELLEAKAYRVSVYIAGDYDAAKMVCREYTNGVGLCVTLEHADYIYTGGAESGVVVGVSNYPRLPASEDVVWSKAEGLAKMLMERLFQKSVMVCDGVKTVWFSVRDQD